jgi:NADPH2:quinone reductase
MELRMKAVAFTHAYPITHEDALIDVHHPEPHPRHADLLVEIKAVSVNPVDTKVRRTAEPLGEERVLGFDAAGIVRGMGPDVRHFSIGDEVWYAGTINRPGTNSEFHLVDERIVGHKPRSLSYADAAALPLTALTAWEMLFDRFRIPRDANARAGTLLIIGGAGGVGSMAIQLARKLTGLRVIATASRPETIAWCKEMGAHDVISHKRGLSGQLADLGLKGADYVFSTNTPAFSELVKAVLPEGHIGLIDDPQPFDARELKSRSIALHWESMFTRSVFHTADMIEQQTILEQVARLIDRGILRTTRGEHYGTINAANLKRAHGTMEKGTAIGKIVLEGF